MCSTSGSVFIYVMQSSSFLGCEDGEGILEYTKRYKQIRDNAKGSLGETFVEAFVKTTREYRELQKKSSKRIYEEYIKNSAEACISYLYMRNAVEVWISDEEHQDKIQYGA